jgi:2-oxoglutarate dehydrogenase E1 component
MEGLKNYNVGGTIHVIINNQIGFTTTPDRARSGTYCSDVAKMINAPIFHVNGDSMESVAKTFAFAAEYRQKFQKDVVVDLIGYRKMGHNELDNPSFTQPLMYKIVHQMKPVRDKFREQLISEGLEADKLDSIEAAQWAELEDAYKASKTCKYAVEAWSNPTWEKIMEPTQYGKVKDTGVDIDELTRIGIRIATLPADDKFHPSVVKIFNDRLRSIQSGKGIDWGTAEALAFASLISEGYHVRLSGQDVERGTFSHRHAHVFYQDRDGCYVPINSVMPNASGTRNFIASCSHLSEYAVLGFEYGYAATNPNTLCLWEAQFGDFANGAQIMIDTNVVSGETKWNVSHGLIMLLPHGYDGNGPEHSSARLERFLQLSDASDMAPTEDITERHIMENTNIIVANCSTAAQYFHLLRA